MSNAQELRDKATRTLRAGRKAKAGPRDKDWSKVYGTVAAAYKNLAHEEEKLSGEKERSAARRR